MICDTWVSNIIMKKLNHIQACPRCYSTSFTKSGKTCGRQRYRCKDCNYHFSVNGRGKSLDSRYVVLALQLYLEGLSLRAIEKVLGISHVTVRNWIMKYAPGMKGLRRSDTRVSVSQVRNWEELTYGEEDMPYMLLRVSSGKVLKVG